MNTDLPTLPTLPIPSNIQKRNSKVGQRSGYTPSWERLKEKKAMIAKLKVPEDMPLEQREKLYKRYRKALSTRKEKDLKYRAQFPTAKITCVDKDLTATPMWMHFKLIYLAEQITLSDLVILGVDLPEENDNPEPYEVEPDE